MYCPECGANNEDAADYCSSCGENLELFRSKAGAAEETTPSHERDPVAAEQADDDVPVDAEPPPAVSADELQDPVEEQTETWDSAPPDIEEAPADIVEDEDSLLEADDAPTIGLRGRT